MTLNQFLNEQQIVEDLLKNLHPTKLGSLAEFKFEDLIQLHHSFGRMIRNEYKLWNQNNPLTLLDYVPQLEGGCDVNPKHPDAVSFRIMQQVHNKLMHRIS